MYITYYTLYMYMILMFCDVILQQNWATGAHVNGVTVFWYVKSRPLFGSIKLKVWSPIKSIGMLKMVVKLDSEQTLLWRC